jgi:hypothetical protein
MTCVSCRLYLLLARQFVVEGKMPLGKRLSQTRKSIPLLAAFPGAPAR